MFGFITSASFTGSALAILPFFSATDLANATVSARVIPPIFFSGGVTGLASSAAIASRIAWQRASAVARSRNFLMLDSAWSL